MSASSTIAFCVPTLRFRKTPDAKGNRTRGTRASLNCQCSCAFSTARRSENQMILDGSVSVCLKLIPRINSKHIPGPTATLSLNPIDIDAKRYQRKGNCHTFFEVQLDAKMLLLIFFVSHLATFRGAANAQTNDLLSVGALVKFVSCYSDYSGVDGPMDPAGIVHTTSSALDCLIDCASYVYAGWNGVAGCYCGNSYHIELLVEENLNVCRVSVTKRGRNRRSYSHIAIFKVCCAPLIHCHI